MQQLEAVAQSSRTLAQQRYASIASARQGLVADTRRARPVSPVRTQQAVNIPIKRERPQTATAAGKAARRTTATTKVERPSTAGPQRPGRKPPMVDFGACMLINEEVNAGFQALKYQVHGTPPASPFLQTNLFAQGQFSPGSPLRPKSAVARSGTAVSRPRTAVTRPGTAVSRGRQGVSGFTGRSTAQPGVVAPKAKIRPQTAGPSRRAGRKASICDRYPDHANFPAFNPDAPTPVASRPASAMGPRRAELDRP